MADHLVEGPPNKRTKLNENALSDSNTDITFRLWDLENSLPEELMGSSGLDPADVPTQTSLQQILPNGTSESISNENSSVASSTIQRNQQLSQLLQTKPNVNRSTLPTSSSNSSISVTQRIPSPGVSLATTVKSPHSNNIASSTITLHKPSTPVSPATLIKAADGSSSITNISNSMVSSLNNATGTLNINNMLLMQSKVNTLCSQVNSVSFPISVPNNMNNVHHPLMTSIQPQQVNQQTNAALVNGSNMSLGSSSSISINRGGNTSVSSASHNTVISPHSSHHGILEHHTLNTQGATLKNSIVNQLTNSTNYHIYNTTPASQAGISTSISSITVCGQRQTTTNLALAVPPRYSTPVDSSLGTVSV